MDPTITSVLLGVNTLKIYCVLYGNYQIESHAFVEVSKEVGQNGREDDRPV
jgi:hypothetical protein